MSRKFVGCVKVSTVRDFMDMRAGFARDPRTGAKVSLQCGQWVQVFGVNQRYEMRAHDAVLRMKARTSNADYLDSKGAFVLMR